jgi:PAS domain S-box-containing protein
VSRRKSPDTGSGLDREKPRSVRRKRPVRNDRRQPGSAEVARRDRILGAISQAAESLLGGEDWKAEVGSVLERLGRAADVPRPALLRAEKRPDGAFALRLERAWVHESSLQPPPWPEEIRLSLENGGGELIRCSEQDEVCDLRADRTRGPLRSLMLQRGVASYLSVPILIDREWWGALFLPAIDDPRRWSAAEVEALRISARLIGAAARRRRIQESLTASEQRYRTLVEGAAQPILIIDREGRFLFANRFACEMVALSAEQLAGMSLQDLFPKERADRHMAVIRRALESGGPAGGINPTVIRGQTRWFSSRVQPLLDVGDGHEAAIVILQDVTEQKTNEARVLAYQEQLRQLASELAMTEQKERRRIAAKLHDRIGQSLAMARIRLGAARSLLDGRPGVSELEEAIRLVQQSIEDTRTLTFELSPPVLHELGLEPALEWLAEHFEARGGWKAQFEGDGRPAPLRPEWPGLVFQAVQELLVNVVKHAGASAVRVRKQVKDEQLVLEVTDDGAGFVPPEADAAGAEFGLFSIRERLRLLGGSLEIHSRPGEGTRATIRVPLSKEEPSPEEEPRR